MRHPRSTAETKRGPPAGNDQLRGQLRCFHQPVNLLILTAEQRAAAQCSDTRRRQPEGLSQPTIDRQTTRAIGDCPAVLTQAESSAVSLTDVQIRSRLAKLSRLIAGQDEGHRVKYAHQKKRRFFQQGVFPHMFMKVKPKRRMPSRTAIPSSNSAAVSLRKFLPSCP